MPAFTFLAENEFTSPVRDAVINEVLAEVRQVTGDDWRVSQRVGRVKFFLKKAQEVVQYELYKGTRHGEFQVISFYKPAAMSWQERMYGGVDAACIVAFLYGVLGSDLGRSRGALRQARLALKMVEASAALQGLPEGEFVASAIATIDAQLDKEK